MTGALSRRGAAGCGGRRAGRGRAPWCRRLPASRCDCPGRRPAPAEAPRPPERAARGPRTPPCTTLLSHSTWGRSFMVGFGRNPPKRVHHAGASCPDPPKPCDEDEYKSGAPNPQVGPRHQRVQGCRVVLGCGGGQGVLAAGTRALHPFKWCDHALHRTVLSPLGRCWRARWWAAPMRGTSTRTRGPTTSTSGCLPAGGWLAGGRQGWPCSAGVSPACPPLQLPRSACPPASAACSRRNPPTPPSPSPHPRSEVALDYNAGLTGALAGLIELLPTTTEFLPLGDWQ